MGERYTVGQSVHKKISTKTTEEVMLPLIEGYLYKRGHSYTKKQIISDSKYGTAYILYKTVEDVGTDVEAENRLLVIYGMSDGICIISYTQIDSAFIRANNYNEEAKTEFVKIGKDLETIFNNQPHTETAKGKNLEKSGLDDITARKRLFTRSYISFYYCKADDSLVAVFYKDTYKITKKFLAIAKECDMTEITGLEKFYASAPKKLLNGCWEFILEEFVKYLKDEDLYTHEYNGGALSGQAYTNFYPLTDLGRRLEDLGYKVKRPEDSGYYWK